MSDDEETSYDLVVPFVTCTSKGGPHDDQSYVAGWAMGSLWARLEGTHPSIWEDTILTESVPQADLIAMHFGYGAHFVDGPDGWSFMTLTNDPANLGGEIQ